MRSCPAEATAAPDAGLACECHSYTEADDWCETQSPTEEFEQVQQDAARFIDGDALVVCQHRDPVKWCRAPRLCLIGLEERLQSHQRPWCT